MHVRGAGAEWVVLDTVCTIGRWDTDAPAEVFAGVVGAVFDRRGFVIATTDSELRAFTLTGCSPRWTFGGVGGGPAEFSNGIKTVLEDGEDGVAAVGPDGAFRWLDSAGNLTASGRLSHVIGRFVTPVAALTNRGLARLVEFGEFPTGDPAISPNWSAGLVLEADTQPYLTLGPWRGPRYLGVPTAGGIAATPMPFDAQVHAGGRADQIAVFVGHDELRVFDARGGLLHRMSVPSLPTLERARVIETLADGVGEVAEPFLDRDVSPPGASRLFVDRAGRVWIGRPRLLEEATRTWLIVSSNGEKTARFVLDFEPLDASSEHLLGVFDGSVGEPVLKVLTYGERR